MNTDLQKRLDFIIEIDKSKEIIRQTYLADASRKEGDAEHAWHMAVMAFLLADCSNEEIDILKVMKMVLVHDLIEIDAGDTYAYDVEANKSKEQREQKAADRIFNILPESYALEMRGLWEEFEEYNTAEAKFAHTLDNVQPLLLNDASDGKSWREHGVCKEQVMNRNKRTAEGSEVLWDYCEDIIKKHIAKGNLRP